MSDQKEIGKGCVLTSDSKSPDYLRILKMVYDLEYSGSGVASGIGLAKSTVNDFLKRFRDSGMSYPLEPEITNEKLRALLYHENTERKDMCMMPDCEHIAKQLKRKGMTLKKQWERYVLEAKASGLPYYQITQFRYYYQGWRAAKKVSAYLEHLPAYDVMVDYAGKQLRLKNNLTGRKDTKVTAYVSVLPFSNLIYSEGMIGIKEADWIRVNTHMVEFYGGSPFRIVPDNCKVAVSIHKKHELAEVNTAFAEWAEFYGIAVVPARSVSPDDKAAVENAVRIVTQDILVDLEEMDFFTLDELNRVLWEKLLLINTRKLTNSEFSRLELFNTKEKYELQPLPAHSFTMWERKEAKVSKFCLVNYDKAFYSVPYRNAGSTVIVYASPTIVKICNKKGDLLWQWKRSMHQGERKVELSHYPKNYQASALYSGDYLRNRAREYGQNTYMVVDKILNSDPIPVKVLHLANGVLSFASKYSKQAVETACMCAVSDKMCTYNHIKTILPEIFAAIEETTKSGENPLSQGQKEESGIEAVADKTYSRGSSFYSLENIRERGGSEDV